jgi:hypothetical protein
MGAMILLRGGPPLLREKAATAANLGFLCYETAIAALALLQAIVGSSKEGHLRCVTSAVRG